MAIFHLNARIVSRGKGQSAVAKAAYNAHDLLNNENTGERHDYRYKGEVVFSGIFVPRSAPEWVDEIAQNRQALWSAVEKAEKRVNSQLAREIEIALPHELTDQQREWLVKDFVRENFVRHGMIADVAIHAPSPEGDQRNHHAHILLTMRHIGPEGFVEKMREYNGKAHLQEWREKWEHIANRYLERFGHETHIDHRTLEEQGIDREPTIHVGPTATDFERQGTKTERGGINREIKAHNKERDQLNAQSAEARRELEETRKAYNAKCVEEIRAAWKGSSDGLDFMMELNNRGFCLAEDGKGRYAALDSRGFAHRLDEKIYGYLVAPSMRDAIEAVRRDCPALIIPTVEEYRQELCEQREQRRASHLGATLYDRADMVSMQRDAMRHLKDARRIQEQEAKEQAGQQRRQKEERERRERQEQQERQRQERESRTARPALRDPLVTHAKQQGGETPQQEPVRRQETLKELDEIAGHRETIRQRQELAQQQEAARQREELARQQEQKKKEREQQRQKEERERREKQQQQERQREERERYQTKQAPRDQQTEKREHKRATTEQTDAKQRRTHDDAMREIWQRKARAAQERGRDDYERERERER